MTRFLVKKRSPSTVFFHEKKSAQHKATYCISHPTISRLRLYICPTAILHVYMLIRYTPKKEEEIPAHSLSLSPLIYFYIWNVWGPYKKKHNWLPSSSLRLDLLIILLLLHSPSVLLDGFIILCPQISWVAQQKGPETSKLCVVQTPPPKKNEKKKQSWRDRRRMKDL